MWRARLRNAGAPLLLALLVLAAYSNSFQGGFTLDSRQAVINDARIHALTSENLGLIFSHTYWWPYDQSGLYRPLTTLSYLLNYAVLGNADRPLGYHVLNLLLHVLNVWLVYALLRLLGRSMFCSIVAAALWAVHPVLTESVTNIVGRADLLAALGMFCGLWFFIARPRWWPVGLSVATAIAVFSKESAVVLPALMLLFHRQPRRLAIGLAATSVPIAAMLWMRSSVMSEALPRSVPFLDNPLVGVDFLTAKVGALQVIGRYVWLLLWPANLSADYSYSQIVPGPSWTAWATAVAALALGFFWNWRATAFAAITLLPVANVLFPVGTIMAERFLYLPAVAFAIAIAAAWRRPIARVAICLAVATLAARTWMRNPDWRSDRAMAESLVRTSPQSYKGHRLLASELFQAHENTTRVLQEAELALAPLAPLPDDQNSIDTWRLAGAWYNGAAQYRRSAEILARCLRIIAAERERSPDAVYPGTPEVYRLLAEDYHALQSFDEEAVTLMQAHLATGDPAFREWLLPLYRGVPCAFVLGPAGPAINPQCEPVHRHLCGALAGLKKLEEARTYGCP